MFGWGVACIMVSMLCASSIVFGDNFYRVVQGNKDDDNRRY